MEQYLCPWVRWLRRGKEEATSKSASNEVNVHMLIKCTYLKTHGVEAKLRAGRNGLAQP